MTDLQAENTKLRAQIEELERKLYPPPPPPPKKKPDPNRYFLADTRDYKEPWRRVQELLIRWAVEYARERHPKLRWTRVYRWEDIPKGGLYTTPRDMYDAKAAEADVPIYEIDKQTAAIDAIDAQQQRLRDRGKELLDEYPKKTNNRIAHRNAHRVWAHRYLLLINAEPLDGPLRRARRLAHEPFVDYGDIVRAAARIVDDALGRERQVTLETIPGYRSDGAWDCDKCGYPFDADESTSCFTCDACWEGDLARSEEVMTGTGT